MGEAQVASWKPEQSRSFHKVSKTYVSQYLCFQMKEITFSKKQRRHSLTLIIISDGCFIKLIRKIEKKDSYALGMKRKE